jgi:hypothetical protein
VPEPETAELDELLRNNPDAPDDDAEARELAARLLPPRQAGDGQAIDLELADGDVTLSATDDEAVEWCGEQTLGVLEATLASNVITDDARSDIENMIADAVPALEKSKTIGHFNFRWTETSADGRDNTNEVNIDATAQVLNDAWDTYVADLRAPKAQLRGGVRIIDVDVYYEGTLHGSTSSQSNRIFLNAHTVVNDDCRRQTTSAHELFHRVEYSYGYVTGTAGQRWWVEALGSWSQEYLYPDVDDYITRVNSGLADPARGLLGRSYDACHYWKYLGEQVAARSAVASEQAAIGEVLDEYAANGKDAKAASGTVTMNRVGRSFDRFFQDWSKANYLKDLTSPSAKYDYAEDEQVTQSCNRTYGPYRHVAPIIDEKITVGASHWNSPGLAASAYGTNYHRFEIEDGVAGFSLRFTADSGGPCSAHVAFVKGNRWRRIRNQVSTTEHTWTEEFDPGDYDEAVLVVNGLGSDATYTVSIDDCLTGSWRDAYNFVWDLAQAGAAVRGTVTTGCGAYVVTGTIDDDEVTLDATGPCCDFSYTGTIVDCDNGSGTWTNECGGNGNWSMTRVDAAEASLAVDSEEREEADDPTSMAG